MCCVLLIGFQFMSPSWCDAFALIIICSVVVIVIVVFFFYCSALFAAFKFQFFIFHFFFLAVICFPLFISFLTNIGHPLRIWPITPVHTRITNYFHQKRARTNERTNERSNTKNHLSKKMSCTATLFFTMAISNIRHVSRCFVFWLKKNWTSSESEREKPHRNAFTSQFAHLEGHANDLQCVSLCALILCQQNRAENIHYTHACGIDWCEFVVLHTELTEALEMIYFARFIIRSLQKQSESKSLHTT